MSLMRRGEDRHSAKPVLKQMSIRKEGRQHQKTARPKAQIRDYVQGVLWNATSVSQNHHLLGLAAILLHRQKKERKSHLIWLNHTQLQVLGHHPFSILQNTMATVDVSPTTGSGRPVMSTMLWPESSNQTTVGRNIQVCKKTRKGESKGIEFLSSRGFSSTFCFLLQSDGKTGFISSGSVSLF